MGIDMVPNVLNINLSRKKTQVYELTLKESHSYRISPL